MGYPETLRVFDELQVGDRVELKHEVKVGFQSWETVTVGTVIRTDRVRHGLHYQRNQDDKVYSDVIVLKTKEIRLRKKGLRV